MEQFKGLIVLGELLDVTKEIFAYIDRHIDDLDEKQKKIVNEIYTIEKESETSSYSLDVFQKTKDLKNDLKDVSELILKANQKRTKEVI